MVKPRLLSRFTGVGVGSYQGVYCRGQASYQGLLGLKWALIRVLTAGDMPLIKGVYCWGQGSYQGWSGLLSGCLLLGTGLLSRFTGVAYQGVYCWFTGVGYQVPDNG
jgi:hypothetical protein